MSIQTVRPIDKATHLTYEGYRTLPDDGNRYEVVRGELVMTATPLVEHQRVSRNLQFILDRFIRANDWGELFSAPIEVYLGEEDFVQPDLVCVSRTRREIVKEKNIVGAPDLIVEILSPTTTRADRVSKAKLFARRQVQNYWIVDPAAQTQEAFHWEDGTYRLVCAAAEDDTYQPSLFANLTISLSELWR